MPSRYPIFIRLEDQPVLVVGGGPVAARKGLRLVQAGAKVTLVAPVVTEELRALVVGAGRGEQREEGEGQESAHGAPGDPVTAGVQDQPCEAAACAREARGEATAPRRACGCRRH